MRSGNTVDTSAVWLDHDPAETTLRNFAPARFPRYMTGYDPCPRQIVLFNK